MPLVLIHISCENGDILLHFRTDGCEQRIFMTSKALDFFFNPQCDQQNAKVVRAKLFKKMTVDFFFLKWRNCVTQFFSSTLNSTKGATRIKLTENDFHIIQSFTLCLLGLKCWSCFKNRLENAQILSLILHPLRTPVF